MIKGGKLGVLTRARLLCWLVVKIVVAFIGLLLRNLL